MTSQGVILFITTQFLTFKGTIHTEFSTTKKREKKFRDRGKSEALEAMEEETHGKDGGIYGKEKGGTW